MWKFGSLMLFVLLLGSGCGSPLPENTAPPPVEREALRKRLEGITQHGFGGSALGGIDLAIQELKDINETQRKKLLEDFHRLDIVAENDERKKIAQEMVDQLK